MRFSDIGNKLKGYVTVYVEGTFTERFLNICLHRNLDIRNIRRRGTERLQLDMSIDAFKRVRPICRRTKTRAVIIKRQGLPFFIRRYEKRRYALVAAAVLIGILWYVSGHIMGITVFGNDRISTERILENLARSGISIGKSTSGIDSYHIRNRMLNDIDELAWVGINVNGSRVYVEIVERLEKEKRIDFSVPCNLVASKDGVIDSIEARNGQVMIKKGSGVAEGDVLVSGITDTADGIRYVHSYGEVYAKTRYSKSREYETEYTEYTLTGKRKTLYTLSISAYTLPLYISQKIPYTDSTKEVYEKEYRLPIDILPSIKINKTVYAEQSPETKKRTPEEIISEKPNELEEEIKSTLPSGAEVTDTEVESTLTERGTVAVTVTVVCRENIAEERELSVVSEY